jgi:hypothetical protein
VQACHSSLTLEPTLLEHIRVAHAEDLDFINILEWVSKNKMLDFSAVEDKTLRFQGRLSMPNDPESPPYTLHLGSTKTYCSAPIINRIKYGYLNWKLGLFDFLR